MEIIPAIDIIDGKCVRLTQGDYAQKKVYNEHPLEVAQAFEDAGLRRLHLVDLDGAKDGVLANRSVVVALASQKAVRLQVGGGVRSAAVIDDLIRNGVQRVVVGSAAVERPEEVTGWFARFGAERICLALDIRMDSGGEPRVRTHGWTEGTAVSLWEAISRFPVGTVKHVLCTDIERDGAMSGPNLNLYRTALCRFPRLSWQASGGVRNAADLAALAELGVGAAVSGKALLEERMTPEELRPFLPDASFPASTSAKDKS